MLRLVLFLLVPFGLLNAAHPSAAQAEVVVDATGRQISVPDHIAHVLPAGPPAAVLLAAIAPDESMGFTGNLSPQDRAALAEPVASTQKLPRLTGGENLGSLHPDLIVDYGTVSSRYIDLAKDTQARSGVPTLLFDGALDHIPEVARTLGRILHHADRGETVARVAESILAMPDHVKTHGTVYYARGADGLLAAAPGKDITAVFSLLGWKVVAPSQGGTFRTTTVAEIASFDPDYIILSDPAAAGVLTSPAWAGLRAVRNGHAMVAPSVPFGWIEEPPSINRLLGLAWLKGADPDTLATLFNASVYGRSLTSQQVSDMTKGIGPIQ
jgi:iron complex transport system substrate-binding protein